MKPAFASSLEGHLGPFPLGSVPLVCGLYTSMRNNVSCNCEVVIWCCTDRTGTD